MLCGNCILHDVLSGGSVGVECMGGACGRVRGGEGDVDVWVC